MSTEWVMTSKLLSLCYPLLLLLSIFASNRVFSNESALCIKWPKYWSFNFNISPSSEHPGLISTMMDWLDLFAVQGTLKSLFQHHSLKASVFQHSAFFMVQLSHPYMTAGKTRALTIQTFLATWCLYFLIHCLDLSWIFFPRSKHPLISWLKSLQWLWSPRKESLSLFQLFPCLLAMKWLDQIHDLHFLKTEF